MNETGYAAYRNTPARPPMISISDLDPGEYTLAYGYTTDRDTWHAYILNDKIHVLVYTHVGELLIHRQGAAMPVGLLRPDKRVYPDTVNLRFAELMRDADAELPFIGNFDFTDATVADRAARGAFKGKTHYDPSVCVI